METFVNGKTLSQYLLSQFDQNQSCLVCKIRGHNLKTCKRIEAVVVRFFALLCQSFCDIFLIMTKGLAKATVLKISTNFTQKFIQELAKNRKMSVKLTCLPNQKIQKIDYNQRIDTFEKKVMRLSVQDLERILEKTKVANDKGKINSCR